MQQPTDAPAYERSIVHETHDGVTEPTFEKSIKYSRITKDYELKLNGATVGWAHTYCDGEKLLDQLVFERLQDWRRSRVEEAA